MVLIIPKPNPPIIIVAAPVLACSAKSLVYLYSYDVAISDAVPMITPAINPFKIIQKTNCKAYFLDSYFKKNKLFIDIEELTLNDEEELGFSKNLNSYIEEKIKLNPHEYLWQHRRFKSTLGKNKIYK